MKNTMTMTTVAKQICQEIGAKGITLVMAAMMFLLLAGMSVPGLVFNRGVQATQGAGRVAHQVILPADGAPQKMTVNVPTLDLRYTASSEKSLSERRGHRRHGGAAASSAAASGGRHGGAAASSAAASGDGGAAASSAAASGDGGAAASSAAASGNDD